MSNQTLLNRSLQSVWHPCTQMKHHETFPLIPIQRGEGVWLVDADGKRYLDAVSSWWVNLFGHNNPRIKEAIKLQLDTLEHVMLAGFTHEPVVNLSEKLAKLTGLGHAFYASDGGIGSIAVDGFNGNFGRCVVNNSQLDNIKQVKMAVARTVSFGVEFMCL